MCIQVPCVYLLSAASTVIRNNYIILYLFILWINIQLVRYWETFVVFCLPRCITCILHVYRDAKNASEVNSYLSTIITNSTAQYSVHTYTWSVNLSEKKSQLSIFLCNFLVPHNCVEQQSLVRLISWLIHGLLSKIK